MRPGELTVAGKVAIQNSWKVLTDLFPDEVLAGAEPVAFVSSRTTHTQAWVHCNRQQSTVCCCSTLRPFRGRGGGRAAGRHRGDNGGRCRGVGLLNCKNCALARFRRTADSCGVMAYVPVSVNDMF